MNLKETYIVGNITDTEGITTGYVYFDFSLLFWFLAIIVITQILRLFKK